jgi:glycosyltransferase involved in cell wall biosynthesis
LISIITVSRNPGDSLYRTLESVKKQTSSDFEYLVVDGASDQRTLDIYKEYSEIIRVFRSEPDHGIFDAMNKGIELSSGEYIVFLNAGDAFTTEFTIEAISELVREISVELYFGKIVWVDTQRKSIITSKHEHIKDKLQLLNENFPHPATIYTRNAFIKYGNFDLRFPVYADYEWNLRALVLNDASFTYRDLILTTFYTGGISTSDTEDPAKAGEKQQIKNAYFSKKNTKSGLFGSKNEYTVNNSAISKLNRN